MNQLKSNLRQLAGQAGAAGDEDQLAASIALRERVERLDHRAAHPDGARRILEQHALAVALRQDHRVADSMPVIDERQGRQWGQRKALGRSSARLGLEPQVPGREQEILRLGLVARRPAEPMGQVGRLSGHMVQAGDQADGIQTGPHRRHAAGGRRGRCSGRLLFKRCGGRCA